MSDDYAVYTRQADSLREAYFGRAERSSVKSIS